MRTREERDRNTLTRGETEERESLREKMKRNKESWRQTERERERERERWREGARENEHRQLDGPAKARRIRGINRWRWIPEFPSDKNKRKGIVFLVKKKAHSMELLRNICKGKQKKLRIRVRQVRRPHKKPHNLIGTTVPCSALDLRGSLIVVEPHRQTCRGPLIYNTLLTLICRVPPSPA